MGLNSGGQRLGGKIWIEERQLKKRVELLVEQVPRQAGTSVRADKKAFLRSESASRPSKCKPFRITFPQQQRGHPSGHTQLEVSLPSPSEVEFQIFKKNYQLFLPNLRKFKVRKNK